MSEQRFSLKDALDSNRTILLEALSLLGIQKVFVTYEGGGDSGDVEQVSVEPASLEHHLHEHRLAVWCLRYSTALQHDFLARDIEKPIPLIDALKQFALDWLEVAYPGWEINDGARGVVVIHVTEQSCRLEHHQFYVESQLYEHTL